MKTLLLLGKQNREKTNEKAPRNPRLQRATIGAGNSEKMQLLTEPAASFEQQACAIAIGQVSGRDQNGQYEFLCIDKNMLYPSYNELAAIVASHSFGGNARFDRLTIDAASSWMLVSPASWTHSHAKRLMQPSPSPIIPYFPVVGVNTLTRRKVGRQHSPLDVAHSQIICSVDDLSHNRTAGSSARFGRLNQMLDN